MDYTSNEMAHLMEQTQLHSGTQSQSQDGRKKKDRGHNWSAREDLSLCKAWIAISEDGIISTEQQMSAFWARAYQFFVADFGDSTSRDGKKMRTRWSNYLLPLINKFCSYIEQLENNRPSGMTDQGVYDQACSQFYDSTKKEWIWGACYEFLKDKPKWRRVRTKNYLAPRANRSKKRSSDGEPITPGSSSTPTSSVPFSQASVSIPEIIPEPVVNERPAGKKELKERRKKEKESASANLVSTNAAINKMLSTFEKRASSREENERRKLEMKRELEFHKLQMKEAHLQKAEEAKILSTSLDKVSEEYRALFKARQDSIAAKWQHEQSQSQSQPPYGMPYPHPSYGMSHPPYGMPQPSYGMPQPSYMMPQPQPPYGMPHPSYGMPQTSYVQPSYPQPPYVVQHPSDVRPVSVGTPGSAVGSNVGDARSSSGGDEDEDEDEEDEVHV